MHRPLTIVLLGVVASGLSLLRFALRRRNHRRRTGEDYGPVVHVAYAASLVLLVVLVVIGAVIAGRHPA